MFCANKDTLNSSSIQRLRQAHRDLVDLIVVAETDRDLERAHGTARAQHFNVVAIILGV